MDISAKIKTMYTQNETFRKLFDFFGTYSRNMNTSSVQNVSWQTKLDEEMIKKAFHDFESIGLGRYVPGRAENPNRFEWWRPMTLVAAVAKGTSDEPLEVDVPAPVTGNGGAAALEGNEMIRHSYNLRTDLVVTLMLPRDLTQGEANRFANFVKTLSFDGQAEPARRDFDILPEPAGRKFDLDS
jgi:hypothetical protein